MPRYLEYLATNCISLDRYCSGNKRCLDQLTLFLDIHVHNSVYAYTHTFSQYTCPRQCIYISTLFPIRTLSQLSSMTGTAEAEKGSECSGSTLDMLSNALRGVFLCKLCNLCGLD